MTDSQLRWTLDNLTHASLGRRVVWASPRHEQWVRATLGTGVTPPARGVPNDLDTLVAVGGGTLIDRAKFARRDQAPRTRLIAIPTIWGSGSEASPIAVEGGAVKRGVFASEFLPDVRVSVPELGVSVTGRLALDACGDAWAHVLEAFTSPLASDTLHAEAADVMRGMLTLPLAYHPDWFEYSARACVLQARSSVGLVHGIAHVLEPPMRREIGDEWGHARLCAVFLLPALDYNRNRSAKVDTIAAAHNVDLRAVVAHLDPLYDASLFALARPFVDRFWTQIRRDPCTRTNVAVLGADAATAIARVTT